MSHKGDLREAPPPTRPYSILPKKIISVIGLESSGTQFVSKIIQDALDSGPYREGSSPCRIHCTGGKDDLCCRQMIFATGHACRETNEVMVQHFSLPWGGSCHENPDPPLVDVILPLQCTRDHHNDAVAVRECNAMASELWGVSLDGKAMQYPWRYQLDIAKSKEWYDNHGVEQVFVIVVRDEKISFAARHDHCSDTELRRREEAVGTRIIDDAIRRYILGDEGEGAAPGGNETSPARSWDAGRHRGRGAGRAGGRRLSALASRNGVVVVSYELLVKLSGVYVRMLYRALGIESDAVPDVRNSNEKYLNSTLTT